MHDGSPSMSPPGTGMLRRSASFLFEAMRGMTWRHVGWTALLGLLSTMILTTVSHGIGVFLFKSWEGRFRMFAENLVIFEAGALTFLACVLAADQAVRQGAARVRCYAVAVLVASVLFAAIDVAYKYYLTDFFRNAQPWWKPVHAVSTLMWALVLGGFATFVYADFKRNRESALAAAGGDAAAHAGRPRRPADEAPGHAGEGRAAVPVRHARPHRRDLRTRPAKGQRTIDDLIVYLRTAMPQMNSSLSTLAREIELVRTYVAIVAACSGDRVRLAIEGDDDWAQVAFPPMLLLPLFEHAITSGRLTRPEDGAFTLRSVKVNGNLQITVGHGGNAFSDVDTSDAIGRVREHLQTLFDAEARLDLRKRADRGTEIMMEIPG